MDLKKQVTIISVHSPTIQFASCGECYISYAVSLKSTNPCFTYSSSQTRRRYSEFHHLRQRLAVHHPTVKPPHLPPKKFFNRFSDDHIEERRQGLQKFLEQVLEVFVYLSDKSLHMFLQTSYTSSQIDQQCLGDVPIPELIDSLPSTPCCYSESTSSSASGPGVKPATLFVESTEEMESAEAKDAFPAKLTVTHFTPKFHGPVSKILSIPKRPGSLDSSPCSSLSSLETSYCSDFNRSRRVSFNENVTVAVVYNQLWNIATEPIRTDF